MKEAERKKHLMHEVVWWRVLDEINEDIAKNGDDCFLIVADESGHGGLGCFPISGKVEAGRVLVKNVWGACWTMTVEEFDSHYRAR